MGCLRQVTMNSNKPQRGKDKEKLSTGTQPLGTGVSYMTQPIRLTGYNNSYARRGMEQSDIVYKEFSCQFAYVTCIILIDALFVTYKSENTYSILFNLLSEPIGFNLDVFYTNCSFYEWRLVLRASLSSPFSSFSKLITLFGVRQDFVARLLRVSGI